MISNKDRSYYIGASDTALVVGNWKTRTFERWYLTKLGFDRMDFENEAMMTGTAYEHRILESLAVSGLEMDRQIVQGRLRVNLDGSTDRAIYEVKTYRFENGFKVSKKYREQVQVQMYATGYRIAYIAAYGLLDDDYKNFYREIDPARLTLYPVEYDEGFVETYLSRYGYLSYCLEHGLFPTEEGYAGWKAEEP